jgi:hypothetical protein
VLLHYSALLVGCRRHEALVERWPYQVGELHAVRLLAESRCARSTPTRPRLTRTDPD